MPLFQFPQSNQNFDKSFSGHLHLCPLPATVLLFLSSMPLFSGFCPLVSDLLSLSSCFRPLVSVLLPLSSCLCLSASVLLPLSFCLFPCLCRLASVLLSLSSLPPFGCLPDCVVPTADLSLGCPLGVALNWFPLTYSRRLDVF